MSIRYVTVDCWAHVMEVSHLRDRFDKPTRDPAIAERCIVKLPDGQLVACTTDEAPVYTVH